MARGTVVQNIEAERNALRDSLKSGAEGGANNRYAAGTNIPQVLEQDPGTRKLLQEQVYMRAYGTGNPNFAPATPARTTTPTVQTPTRYSPTPTQQAPAVQQQNPGVMSPGYQAFIDANNARYGQSTQFDEQKLREQSMSDLQRQIDAIRQKYVGVINEAQREGQGRLGQQRGLSTISGTRFSPRGAAEQTQVENMNQKQIDAINADMNAEIANATAAANGFLTQQIQYQQEAATKRADSYMNNMLSAWKMYQDQQSNEQEQAARYAQLTGMYGNNPTLALRQYLSDAQNQGFQQDLSNRELQLKIDQANQKNYSLSQLDDGTVVSFDPATGQMTTLGRYAKPVSTGSGSRYSAGDPLSSAAMNAYYSAYGQLPSESLIPYYTDIYSSSGGGLRYNPLPEGQYGPPTPEIYNPFSSGAATLDSRYGRGASSGVGHIDPVTGEFVSG